MSKGGAVIFLLIMIGIGIVIGHFFLPEFVYDVGTFFAYQLWEIMWGNIVIAALILIIGIIILSFLIRYMLKRKRNKINYEYKDDVDLLDEVVYLYKNKGLSKVNTNPKTKKPILFIILKSFVYLFLIALISFTTYSGVKLYSMEDGWHIFDNIYKNTNERPTEKKEEKNIQKPKKTYLKVVEAVKIRAIPGFKKGKHIDTLNKDEKVLLLDEKRVKDSSEYYTYRKVKRISNGSVGWAREHYFEIISNN